MSDQYIVDEIVQGKNKHQNETENYQLTNQGPLSRVYEHEETAGLLLPCGNDTGTNGTAQP